MFVTTPPHSANPHSARWKIETNHVRNIGYIWVYPKTSSHIMPHAKKQANSFFGNWECEIHSIFPWFSRLEYDPNVIILVNDVVMSLVWHGSKKGRNLRSHKPPGFEVWRHVFLLEQLQNDDVMPVDLRFFFFLEFRMGQLAGTSCRMYGGTMDLYSLDSPVARICWWKIHTESTFFVFLYTLPNRKVVFQPFIFRSYVSFRECRFGMVWFRWLNAALKRSQCF